MLADGVAAPSNALNARSSCRTQAAPPPLAHLWARHALHQQPRPLQALELALQHGLLGQGALLLLVLGRGALPAAAAAQPRCHLRAVLLRRRGQQRAHAVPAQRVGVGARLLAVAAPGQRACMRRQGGQREVRRTQALF